MGNWILLSSWGNCHGVTPLVLTSPWDQEKTTKDTSLLLQFHGTVTTGYPVRFTVIVFLLWALPSSWLWLDNSCLLMVCFPGYWGDTGTGFGCNKNQVKLNYTHTPECISGKSKGEKFAPGVYRIQKTKNSVNSLFSSSYVLFSTLASFLSNKDDPW